MSLNHSKPHNGRISPWYRFRIPNCDEGLGFVVVGYRPDHQPSNEEQPWIIGRFRYTSLVLKHEGDEIETLNSRYTLVGQELLNKPH